MRVLWRSVILSLAALLQLGAVAPDPQPPSPSRPAPRPCKVLHLHIRGDLDSLRLARDFAETLAEARADNVEVLLLELSGNRWRDDVVHAMARALRATESPGAGSPRTAHGMRLLVILDDPSDRRVGCGHAALAVLADACSVLGRTSIIYEPAADLRATAPPETDWETVERELQGYIYLAAKDRRADALLSSLVPRPAGPIWAARSSDPAAPWRLSGNRPDSSAIQIVPACAEGAVAEVRIEPAMALNVGIATCEARDAGHLLGLTQIRARPILHKELSSGLHGARERVTRLIIQLDDALRAIEIDASQAGRLRGRETVRKKRDAGDHGARALAEAESRLLDAESIMSDYPELLAALPPGRTPVGQDSAKHPQLWRWKFQDFRDQIADLRATCEALSRTP